MRLPSTLAWLVDEASAAAGADHFLAAPQARQLIADGLPPRRAGTLMVAAPQPDNRPPHLAVAGGDRKW